MKMKRGVVLTIYLSFIIWPCAYAQWNPEVRLSKNAIWATLNENAGPCLAVSGDTLHMVWMENIQGVRASYYIRSRDGE